MHVNLNMFVMKMIIYMSKLEGMKKKCSAKRKKWKKFPCMINILRIVFYDLE
jgi:hypothetical protein